MEYNGFKGITWDSIRNKWYTRITFANVRYAIGRFNTEEEAMKAYRIAQEMGVVKFKAWYFKDPAHRGSILDSNIFPLVLSKEENKIKTFSFLVDSSQEENNQISW